jgi:hypothetical protein
MILTQILSSALGEHWQSSDVGFDGRGAAGPLSNFESRNYHGIQVFNIRPAGPSRPLGPSSGGPGRPRRQLG